MPLVHQPNSKVIELKSGNRTLLQEAHELVVNGNYPDIPEALDFITDPENYESLMSQLIAEEEYEECAKLMTEKQSILMEISAEQD